MVKRVQAFDRAVGARVRLFRIQRGMSQSELATKLGVTFQQLQKNEAGLNRISFHRATLAVDALGITLNELAGLDGIEADTKHLPSKIDIQIFSVVRGLPPAVKPDALKALRLFAKTRK